MGPFRRVRFVLHLRQAIRRREDERRAGLSVVTNLFDALPPNGRGQLDNNAHLGAAVSCDWLRELTDANTHGQWRRQLAGDIAQPQRRSDNHSFKATASRAGQ